MGFLQRLFQSPPRTHLHRYESLHPGDAGSNGHELELEIEDERKVLDTTHSKQSKAVRYAKTTAVFLTPSFVQRNSEKTPRKITETSYLNGIRGLAASLVYVLHTLY
tara:strand:- start:977 stop:1297 length:321 start_codon:yes stop_codon:yes gene_type:complete